MSDLRYWLPVAGDPVNTHAVAILMLLAGVAPVFAQSAGDALRLMENSCFSFRWLSASTCDELSRDNALELLRAHSVPLAIQFCSADDLTTARANLEAGQVPLNVECGIVLDLAESLN